MLDKLVHFHCKPVFILHWYQSQYDALCALVCFFFFEKNREKMNINFFSYFMSVFLCKFGMDGKILSRPFQCIIVFRIFEVTI